GDRPRPRHRYRHRQRAGQRRRSDYHRRHAPEGPAASGGPEVKPDEQGKGNIARFFTHNRQIGWVALAATLAWGVFGYMNMPKRKDPDIPVRIALAIAPWPGLGSAQGDELRS